MARETAECGVKECALTRWVDRQMFSNRAVSRFLDWPFAVARKQSVAVKVLLFPWCWLWVLLTFLPVMGTLAALWFVGAMWDAVNE